MSTVADQPKIIEPIHVPAQPASIPDATPEAVGVRPSLPLPREDRPFAIRSSTFLSMIEAEVFPDDARVYLQDGSIYEKMAKTKPHSSHAFLIHEALIRVSSPDWMVFNEGEFVLDTWNAKLPDLALIRAADRRAYLASPDPMRASDIVLAVEIAVTSLSKDLGVNLERYARAMIPNYWVADVTGRRLFVHSGPSVVEGSGIYAKVDIVLPGASFDLILDGQQPVRFAFEDLML